MQLHFSRFTILVALALAACLPTLPEAPLSTPEIWRVQMPASLAWVGARMNVCAQQQAGVALLVDFQPPTAPMLETSDIIVRWGDPDPQDGSDWYKIGEETLAIIIHPQNSIQSISTEQLRQAFTGQVRDWSEVADNEQPLVPVTLPDQDETTLVLGSVAGEAPSITDRTLIAADPAAMIELVAANPGAIGYLPSRWLNESVRELSLSSDPPAITTRPVLLRFTSAPTPAQTGWLACLQ